MSLSPLHQTALITSSASVLSYILGAPPGKLLRGVQLAAFLSVAASLYNQPAFKRAITSRNNPLNNLSTLLPSLSRDTMDLAIVSTLISAGLIATGKITAPPKIKTFARMFVALTMAAGLWHIKKKKPDLKELQQQFKASIPTAYPANPQPCSRPTPLAKDLSQEEAVDIYKRLGPHSRTLFELPVEFRSLQEYVEAGDIEHYETLLEAFLHEIQYKKGPIAKKVEESIKVLITSLNEIKKRRQEQLRNDLLQNYEALDMGGEGGCFFRAVLGCTKKRSDVDVEHSNFRKLLVERMKSNRSRYEPLIEICVQGEDGWFAREVRNSPGNNTFEKYLNYMGKSGSWGGNPETQAASDYLQQPIICLHSRNDYHPVLVTPATTRIRQPLTIKNLGNRHFQSLRPKKS